MAARASSKTTKPSTQLFALTTDKINFYYGELCDNHLLRGSPRAIYASNVKIVDMSAEWKAYLSGRVIEIEQPDSKWLNATLKPSVLKYMLQHESGYVMPLLCVRRAELCVYFPRMGAAAPAKMPVQTVCAPGVVAAVAAVAAPAAKPTSHRRRVVIKDATDSDGDSVAEAVCNGYDDEDPAAADEGKKERDALRVAMERGFIRMWR